MLAKAVAASPALVAVFEKSSWRMVYLNSTGRRWLDPEAQTMLGDFSLVDILGVSSADRLQNEILLQASVRGKWNGECTLRDIWGSEIPVQAALTINSDESIRGHGFVCLQAVKTSVSQGRDHPSDHELLHALLETLPDAVYFKDLHSRFLRVSRALARKDGCDDPAEFIGLTDFDRFTVEHAQSAYADEQRIIKTGEPIIDFEEKETWPDGRVTWVSSTKLPLRDPDGRIAGTFGISREITGRKLAEQANHDLEIKLQLAQKLESIGRLAAGVAHEVNTPTQFITDNAHFLTQAFGQLAKVVQAYRALGQAAAGHPALENPQAAAIAVEREAELDYLLAEIPKTLQQSLDGLGRIGRIVRSLKEFSHPNSARRTPVDLNHAIETAVTVSRHEWKYVADVVTDFDPALPAVPCVVDEFNQVILNLVINAAHAIESALKSRGSGSVRGTITVRTRHDAEHAVVEVEDTGAGIPEEARNHIFEPFFTTKEVGKGTGQGLAIVHTVIVKHHHGSIDFRSEVGVGTTFHLRLPLTLPPDLAPP